MRPDTPRAISAGPIRIVASHHSAGLRGVYRRLFPRNASAQEQCRPAGELWGIAEEQVACLADVPRLLSEVVQLDVEVPETTAECSVGAGSIDVVVVGVSTGGPSALERVLPRLPIDFPAPVLVAQHMPKVFTSALTLRLARCCAMPVREAYDGAQIEKGTIWIAPGDAHVEINESVSRGGRTISVVRLRQEGERSFCMPSVDVLFRSAAAVYGAGTLAVVMTGMGSDGLAGARAVYNAGGTVLAQDESTSAVWGMPGRVFAAGIVRRLVPLDEIAREIVECAVPFNAKGTAQTTEERAAGQTTNAVRQSGRTL